MIKVVPQKTLYSRLLSITGVIAYVLLTSSLCEAKPEEIVTAEIAPCFEAIVDENPNDGIVEEVECYYCEEDSDGQVVAADDCDRWISLVE